MGAGLVGDHVGPHAAPVKFGKHVGGVAQQADRFRFAGLGPAVDHRQRFVEAVGLFVDVAGAQAEIDAVGVAFDRQTAGPGHHSGQGLRAAHATEPAGQNPLALQVAVIVLAAGLGEGLVGALNDALAADVDPRPGGHLAIHRQTLLIELVEMVPGRPMRHEVGIRDQNARRIGVGLDDGNRLAGLDHKRFIGFQVLEAGDDGVEILPGPRRPPNPAIDHQFVRVLGHVGMQVVHQHPQRCFGQPAFGVQFWPGGRVDVAGILAGIAHAGLQSAGFRGSSVRCAAQALGGWSRRKSRAGLRAYRSIAPAPSGWRATLLSGDHSGGLSSRL